MTASCIFDNGAHIVNLYDYNYLRGCFKLAL
jgi:hypothetical protein